MLRAFSPRFGLTVLILAAAPGAAMAYIDPGNGAYMVQALFTLVGAALFYVRHPIRSAKLAWAALLRRFGSDSGREPNGDVGAPTPAAVNEHAARDE
jgi:hypothetical protein